MCPQPLAMTWKKPKCGSCSHTGSYPCWRGANTRVRDVSCVCKGIGCVCMYVTFQCAWRSDPGRFDIRLCQCDSSEARFESSQQERLGHADTDANGCNYGHPDGRPRSDTGRPQERHVLSLSTSVPYLPLPRPRTQQRTKINKSGSLRLPHPIPVSTNNITIDKYNQYRDENIRIPIASRPLEKL